TVERFLGVGHADRDRCVVFVHAGTLSRAAHADITSSSRIRADRIASHASTLVERNQGGDSMRLLRSLIISSLLAAAPAYAGGASASASVSVSIKADVDAAGTAQAAAGDALYAKGEFAAALEAYGEGFAKTRDATFLYAEARCQQALGMKDDAKAM